MRIRSVMAAAVLSAAFVVVPVVAATAASTTTNAGGGLWQYGVEGGAVYSNYNHATKNHTATACDNSIFKTCKQVAAIKNQWARASTTASWNGGNTAFWNTL